MVGDIRLGTVQTVDKDKMTARVKFGDKNIISGMLHILQRPIQVESDTVIDGKKIDISIKQWLPAVGEMVVCLMMDGADGNGFILGGF